MKYSYPKKEKRKYIYITMTENIKALGFPTTISIVKMSERRRKGTTTEFLVGRLKTVCLVLGLHVQLLKIT